MTRGYISDIKSQTIKDLTTIPGIGKSIASDLWNIGIRKTADLKNEDPELLYDLSNKYAGVTQDHCLLYVFRCAIYYVNTEKSAQNPEMLKWWNWKDKK